MEKYTLPIERVPKNVLGAIATRINRENEKADNLKFQRIARIEETNKSLKILYARLKKQEALGINEHVSYHEQQKRATMLSGGLPVRPKTKQPWVQRSKSFSGFGKG